jgi:glycine betaine/proline transport system substrate-binding protein
MIHHHLINPNFVLVPTGSAAALDGVIAKACEQKQGIIAQYSSPTSLLVQYPMVRLGPRPKSARSCSG